MEVYAGMNPRMPASDAAGYADRVERLGFDGLHVPEMIHDPFVISALAISATTSLRVRTGVALAFVRSPMVSALAAWSLAHQSAGRFDLGLGSQIRANIEERYGMVFQPPVARMADYLAAVRACFDAFETGAGLDYHGGFYRLTRLQPDFRPDPLESVRHPELWLGGVGNQMVALAGRQADGLITHPTNSHHGEVRERIAPGLSEAASAAGRATPSLLVAPMVACGGTADEVAQARERVRRRLAFLYSTPAYGSTLARLDAAHVGAELRRLIQDKRWDALASVLPDDLFDELVPSGSWSEVTEELSERYGTTADALLLRPPQEGDADTVFAQALASLRNAHNR